MTEHDPATDRMTGPVTGPRSPGRPVRQLLVAVAVAMVVVLLDQFTKAWAVHRLANGSIHVAGPLSFSLTYNTGSAFSLFTGRPALVATLALGLVAFLVVLAWRAASPARAAILGLILGGALGNLADRAFRPTHGGVVDFVALSFWPTFNLADSCVVVGSILLAASFLWRPAAR